MSGHASSTVNEIRTALPRLTSSETCAAANWTCHQAGTTATQFVAPYLALNLSASADAASSPWTTAKVVEPLPDMSVAAAPLARRNSWNSASSGYFSSAGASSEL